MESGFDSRAPIAIIMSKDKENLVRILKAYAAGINASVSDYHASVDISGDVPQLVIS